MRDKVFLFYDGYERNADESLGLVLRGEVRRHARYVWRKLRGRQVRTGFYTWFLMLKEALETAGVEVHVNNFRLARKYPDQPIGVLGYPSVIPKVDALPNPRLLGPGLYDTPNESAALLSDPRNKVYLQTCEWTRKMFEPMWGDKLALWFGGYDVTMFPDSARIPKTFDVLIYDKIYFDREANYPRLIEPLIQRLEREGLTYTVVRYGEYAYEDYIDKLKRSRCMAFFAHSETQGMAYQECLAVNVPVFAWDEGIWPNPKAAEVSDDPVPCTSTPCFDSRCGLHFKAENLETKWSDFWSARENFSPRKFVEETLNFENSAKNYLLAYARAGMAGADQSTQYA
jgi:hypothetical protein